MSRHARGSWLWASGCPGHQPACLTGNGEHQLRLSVVEQRSEQEFLLTCRFHKAPSFLLVWVFTSCSLRKASLIPFYLSLFSKPILIFLHSRESPLEALPCSSLTLLSLNVLPTPVHFLTSPCILWRWLSRKVDVAWLSSPLLPLLREHTPHSVYAVTSLSLPVVFEHLDGRACVIFNFVSPAPSPVPDLQFSLKVCWIICNPMHIV